MSLRFSDKAANQRLFDLAEIFEIHADRFVVRVPFEENLLIFGQTLIDDRFHAVLRTKWR